MKRTYKDRKEYMRAYQNRWLQERRSKWISENGPCRGCGSTEELEVDHVDPKEKEYHPTRLWSLKEETRIEELAKCQVLCKACHRQKSNEEMSRPITHGLMGYHRSCRCITCKKAQSVDMKKYHDRTRKHSQVGETA